MRNLSVLTIHQPWASAIVHGRKRIENRTFAPPSSLIGEVLAIHAGKTFDLMGAAILRTELGFNPAEHPDARGAIVGICTVLGYVTPTGGDLRGLAGSSKGWADRLAELRRDPFYAGEFGWIIDDVVALPEPVPCRGMQGVWWAERDTVSAVAAQLGREVANV